MKSTTHLDHIGRWKQHLVQIGRIDGPAEYLSLMLAVIRSHINTDGI